MGQRGVSPGIRSPAVRGTTRSRGERPKFERLNHGDEGRRSTVFGHGSGSGLRGSCSEEDPLGAVIEKVGPRVYRLMGDLDATNVGDVDGVLESDLSSEEDLTLDLSELTFLDSMGVSLLVATAGKLGRGKLILLSPDSSVRRILELVQLDQRPNVMIAAGASDE